MKKLNLSADQPIGIFDSGVGGLTVANAISRYLPEEQIIYFGDTAHLPYGDKAPGSIKYYTQKICEFLLEKQCKLIVNACNTASSIAYEEMEKVCRNKALTVNVIDPVVEAVAANAQVKKVGVIGTRGTIRSNVYERKLLAKNNSLEVSSLATPLLVPVIEEMLTNSEISTAVIRQYLSDEKLGDPEVLILGCTHYPLIRPEIERFYEGRTVVVDSADIVGKYVQQFLRQADLLKTGSRKQHRFFVSDYTDSFEQSTHAFFGEEVNLKQINIWS